MRYVMIGNSAAAVGCVEAIRQRDKKGSITIISSEPHHTYSRPLISYLLYGKTDRQRMKYRPDSFYKGHGATALLGRTAVKIDGENKQVWLENGEKIPYDKLLVSTGSTPFLPPVAGLDQVESRFTFQTLDDANALEQAVDSASRVLILGAGLIGLKCAEGLSKRAGSITVVDLADRVLPSILEGEAAKRMEEHIRQQGIEIILSDSVQRFQNSQAELDSGKTVAFDVLVVATGVRPNTALVQEAGGQVARGIVTDQFCRTTLPNVYAAGDCAESHDITCGQSRVLALLPGAYMQGECAGLHMTGEEKPYDKAIPMNAIGFFGLHIISAGSYDGETYVSSTQDGYKCLWYRDNLLKGFILMGEVARAGIYTSLIREQVPLDTVDFVLLKERPQLMAFSRRERSKKLGGVTA